MKKPKLFKPNQKDLERVAKAISKEISPDKCIVSGKKRVQGNKTI